MATTDSSTDNFRILDKIPVSLDAAMVLERLRMHNTSKRIEGMVQELIELVTPVARPKVLYKVSQVSNADGKKLEVDGVEFTYHVPTINFSEGERVFPYVATCGLEVETIKIPPGDVMNVMKGYCLNVIKNVVLRSAISYLQDHLKQTYNLEEISRIGPGEAMGAISQQPKLFSILGDVEGSIGVRLSDHNMMLPEKSNSGIYFVKNREH